MMEEIKNIEENSSPSTLLDDIANSIHARTNLVAVTEPTNVTVPQKYSTVKSPCVFSFTRSTVEPMLVYINGMFKNMLGSHPSVNVADYYRYSFTFRPFVIDESVICPALSIGRLVEAQISYSEGSISTETGSVELSNSTVDITGKFGLLSNLTKRHIGKGQTDEFTIISNGKHTVSVKDSEGNSLIGVNVEMSGAAAYSDSERFTLALTTGEGDVDVLAVRIKVTFGEDVTTQQILVAYGSAVYVKLENSTIYVGPINSYNYPVDVAVTPHATMEIWATIVNTDDIMGTGTVFTAAALVEGKNASCSISSVSKRLCIGGWKYISLKPLKPFKGIIHTCSVHRVDDDPDKAYVLLAQIISNGTLTDGEMGGAETIYADTLLADYMPGNIDVANLIWRDSTANRIDLTLEGIVNTTGIIGLPAGMQVVALPITKDCKATISNTEDGTVQEIDFICHEYVSGVRLAWINRYGAIDQYNFEVIAEETTELEKTKIYTEDGYLTTELSADDYTTVTTRALPNALLRAMTDILVSDHVFLLENEKAEEVDVVSDGATTLNYGALSTLSVRFRPKKRRI